MGLNHMLEVYTLVLFSVTFAVAMLGFSESSSSWPLPPQVHPLVPLVPLVPPSP